MKKANWTNLLSILISLLLPAAVYTQQTTPSIECSSIAKILADPEACDNRPVRIEGKVIQFKLQTSKKGNPYTEFTLADGSKTLTFFSYNHLPLKQGICVQVEGVYYVRREVRSFIFENQVVVEKKTEGIATVPCPEIPSTGKDTRPTPQSDLPQPYGGIWKQWKLISLGILLLIVLAAVAGILVKKRKGEGKIRKEERYRKMGKEFEEYIIRLFPDTAWEIIDRCSDTSLQIGRKILGDVSYDFIVKHRRTSSQFIIQCKYRTRFHYKGGQEGIEWAYDYQIKNYRNFQQEKGYPYQVVIGVGGHPRQPEQLFVLPLDKLYYTFMWKKNLLTGKRDPSDSFTVDDHGVLI